MLTNYAEIMALGAEAELDARGLVCPLPLLKAKLSLRELAPGERLLIRATDAGSWRDIPAYARISQQILVGAVNESDEYIFLLQKV